MPERASKIWTANSAASACSTVRFRRTRSRAWRWARRWPGCGRSCFIRAWISCCWRWTRSINQAANWSYLFAGQASVPLVIRAVINRGGEQGAQHSQALHAMFMHVPGLKVVMPATPADAKGLLMAAVEDPNPVLYIDDRWLYGETRPGSRGTVSSSDRRSGGAARGPGCDLDRNFLDGGAGARAADDTGRAGDRRRGHRPAESEAVGSASGARERAQDRASWWSPMGDGGPRARRPRSRRPWRPKRFHDLQAPVERVTLPDAPAPTSRAEEQAYYPGAGQIVAAARRALGRRTGVAEVSSA